MEEARKTGGPLLEEVERVAALEASEGEHSRAEQKLRERMESSQSVLEAVPEAMIVIDRNRRLVLANRAAREMVKEEDPVARCLACHEVLHGCDVACEELGEQCPLAQIVATKALTTVTHTHLDQHGNEITVEIRAAPVLDKTGQVVQIVETCRDITERKRAEKALRLTQFSVDRAVDAVFWLGPDAKFIYANEMACKRLGYSADELLSMTVHDIDPNFPAEVWPSHWKDLKQRGSFTFESLHRAKDGTMLPVEITVNHIEFEGHEYNLALARDITERKQAHEALQKAHDELEVRVEQRTAELKQSNRDLAEFAFRASHDLQQPLRMMSSFLLTLRQECRDDLDETAQKWIDLSVDAGQRMQRLINDLLSYAHVGTRERHFETLDANALVDQVIADLQAMIESNGAEVKRGELPTVTADATLMMELLQNLISNAIKFHGHEPPRVHVSAESSGSEWIFSVRDNGIGIEPKYRDQIFAVFERLHSTDTYPGSGIGLAICKRVVERHGGRIWCESEPGQGTTFYFSVPFTLCESESANVPLVPQP
jgi:PAS domain S-box-containing protein